MRGMHDSNTNPERDAVARAHSPYAAERGRYGAPDYVCPVCGLRNGDDGTTCLRCGEPVTA